MHVNSGQLVKLVNHHPTGQTLHQWFLYANVFTHKHRAFLSLSTVTAFCLNFILILNQVFLLKCNILPYDNHCACSVTV